MASFDIPDLSTFWPVRPVVIWTAAHVFRIRTPLVYTASGSGDKTFDWVLAFCLFVVAIAGAAIWSVLDRKRQQYVALHKWFRVFIRFCLAGQMFAYGFVKLIPMQMPFPHLTRLVQHFGDFSPMGVLWSSIGASPAYEMFAGSAEVLGGLLLVLPSTTMLGAMVCLADMTQVFTLNMTYDVPVKLFSFHLILLSLFLLVPELSRLANFFLLNRPVEPSPRVRLCEGPRANQIVLAVQVVVALWLVGTNLYASTTYWHQFGGGRTKSPLYGLWDVEQESIDGQIRPPLLTDAERSHRAIFDFPETMAFQRIDDSLANYGASIDVQKNTLALKKFDDKNWHAAFNFQRPAPDQLLLDGNMNGHAIHMQLKLVDRNKFLLVNRGFHWVQEYPFNR